MNIDVLKLERAMMRACEAAVDPAAWSSFLDEIRIATGSYAALIMPLERRSRNSAISTPNIAAGLDEYFQDGWTAQDWNIHARPFLLSDGIARSQQYTSEDLLETHAFYRFLGRHQCRHACIIEWHATPNDRLCLILYRTPAQDPFSDEEASILAGIRGQLNAAARMAHQISQNRVSGTIVGLDIAKMAAIFVDRMGKVTHVNDTALQVLGSHLHVVDGDLLSGNKNVAILLRRAISEILAQVGAGTTEHVQKVSIERPGQQPLLLRIQRLQGEFDLFAHSVGVCVVDVPEQQRSVHPEILQQAFHLTEQEAKIAVRLCQGESLREIAELTGRSYQTLRTHMKSILQKTGTSRQGELIALVAKMKMLEPGE